MNESESALRIATPDDRNTDRGRIKSKKLVENSGLDSEIVVLRDLVSPRFTSRANAATSSTKSGLYGSTLWAATSRLFLRSRDERPSCSMLSSLSRSSRGSFVMVIRGPERYSTAACG